MSARVLILAAAAAATAVAGCASTGMGMKSARALNDVRDCLVVDLSKPERAGPQARPPEVNAKEAGYVLTFPHADPSSFIELMPDGSGTRVRYHKGASNDVPAATPGIVRACL